MKWVEWRQYSGYSERDYLLGPNLRKEFPKDRMPEPGDIPQETIGEFEQPNYEKVYYKTDQDYLYLSMFVNWVFTDLEIWIKVSMMRLVIISAALTTYRNDPCTCTRIRVEVSSPVTKSRIYSELLYFTPTPQKRSGTNPNTSIIFHCAVMWWTL